MHLPSPGLGRVAATFVAAVLAWGAGAPAGARPEDPAAEQALEARFSAVARAWAGRNGDAVVAQTDPEPRAALQLTLQDVPPVAGTFSKAQAKQTLKAYFERLRGVPVLKDVTTPESKRAVPGTRLYDYTYRREGHDPVTTRLQVTLKSVAGSWWLASVVEMPRPRP